MNSSQIKKARLDAIKDEVSQLHPLLKLLLPKLPRVAEVEYTHGTNEMGADFVFTRAEEIFGDLEYVGVIAKTGKIQQNYSDLERQIKECEIERFFKNGKRKIFLNEIMVVTTSSISNGAQQKIYSDYKTRKILFVDGDRLSSLLDKHLPNFWTDVDLEIGDYLHAIWSKIDNLDRSLSLIPSQTDRFYIEQDLYEVEIYDAKHPRKPKRIDIHEQIERNILLRIKFSELVWFNE
jgi:hypothetical protein